ncbi:UbiD family decarboxylase [Pyrofollis japonicus]|nr:UbiD family decarboxylase [Pyrofollis japonicus]
MCDMNDLAIDKCSNGSIEEYLGKLDKTKIKILHEEIEPSGIVQTLEGLKDIVIFKVKGREERFISNLVASREALYNALGVSNDREAYAKFSKALNEHGKLVEGSFKDYFVEKGSNIGVDVLPALRFYRDDGGDYITSSIFIACKEGICNASIHRIMVNKREDYAAARIVPRHLYTLMKKSGGSLPIAIVIGVHPLVLLAAATSPPFGVFEFEIASSLLGGCLMTCRTPIYGIPVPCGASMVVEAIIGPERKKEGPFVDLLQLYDGVREEPVIKPQAVYVNKRYEPYIHVIIPGGIEHMLLMGFPREASIYDAVARAVPRVNKVRLTPGGGMWLHAVVSIEKIHDGDGKTAAFAALAAHPSVKHVIVVDEDVDPDNLLEVEWAIATRVQADKDIVIIKNARGSTLDPSAKEGLTAKMIIDATAPLDKKYLYRRPRPP